MKDQFKNIKDIPIIDMHSHFLINAFIFKKSFFKKDTPSIFWNPLKNRYNYYSATEGGVRGITFDVYVPYFPRFLGGRMGGVRKFVNTYNKIIDESGGKLLHCCTSDQITQAINSKEKIATILAIEGGNVIDKDLNNLKELKRYGVRMITLVHFLTTHIGDAVFGKTIHNGLSPFGKEMVKEMQRIGIIVDLAHSTDKTFFDAIKLADSPMVSSHTGVRALKPNDQRGLSDDQLKAIKDINGLVGIILFPWYLKKMKIFCKIDLVIDHICYVAEKIGVDCVGIGSDMDSNIWLPLDFKDASYFPTITYKLEKRGFTKSEIKKIVGTNYLRVLKTTDSRFTSSSG